MWDKNYKKFSKRTYILWYSTVPSSSRFEPWDTLGLPFPHIFQGRYIAKHPKSTNTNIHITITYLHDNQWALHKLIVINVITQHTWSHQHSLKLGSWCSRVYSKSSNMMETTVQSHQSRRTIVFNHHPKKCIGTNKSTLSQMLWKGSFGTSGS